jgi:hypothetical protein
MLEMGDIPKSSELPRRFCGVGSSWFKITSPRKFESWSCGGVTMPKSTKAKEPLAPLWLLFTSGSGPAGSSVSPSLLLFLGRPICFWGENTQSRFSLRHLVQLGLSPEHFNFRVPDMNQSLLHRWLPKKVLTTLVTRGMKLFVRRHLHCIEIYYDHGQVW